jgi:hypothetical protein
MTRREVLSIPAVALAQTAQPDWLDLVIKRHDDYVDNLLKRQNTSPNDRWRGFIPDEFGIHHPGTGSGIIDACVAAWLHPRSRHHKSSAMPQRIQLAADALKRHQTADGNWHLLSTNFNSPPDTGFIVWAMAPGATLLKRAGNREIFAQLEPILRKAGAGMVKGGVHTPNHRWVVSAALARLYDLFGDASYVRRIDQWLAEGIDIDPDGQFTERSTYVYNAITDNAFVTIAAKLKRPELLEPARKNLESMMYLLHPGYEVVTEISRRQDLNARGDMGPYWFALAYLAHHGKNGQFATLARHFAPTRAGLSLLMEYPELAGPGPAPQPVPDQYTKFYRHNQLVHVRRGPVSAVILGADRNRVFAFRNGDAIINAVRFASAFFGKGQFAAENIEERDGGYFLSQSLEGPYYQPLDPVRKVGPDDWGEVRAARKRTEISKLTQSATVTPTAKGFRLRVQSHGQADVPLAVEINFREGGRFEGPVETVAKIPDAFALKSGSGVYCVGSYGIRFGNGANAHMWTQVRGADAKLPGPSVYLTGFTPFDHTIEFEPA